MVASRGVRSCFTREAPLFASWPCFTREAPPASCFVPFGRPVPLAVVAPLKEKRLPDRFGRVLWLPVATCDLRQQECAALRTLDAGALRQHLALGWEQISPRGLLGALSSPPQAWGICFSPPVAARRPADSAAHDLAKRLDRGLTSAEATVGGSHASQARASPEKGSGGKAAKRHS